MAFRSPRINRLAPLPRPNATHPAAAETSATPARREPAVALRGLLQDRVRQVSAPKAAAKTSTPDADCKRRSRRKATTLPGLITFKTMRLQVPCTVADMSGSGARLQLTASGAASFGDLEHLPDRIVLVLRADRMQVECEIKWRRPDSLGVRFLGPQVPLAAR